MKRIEAPTLKAFNKYRGLTRGWGNLRIKDAEDVRRAVCDIMGYKSPSAFYQLKRGFFAVDMAQGAAITAVFVAKGVDADEIWDKVSDVQMPPKQSGTLLYRGFRRGMTMLRAEQYKGVREALATLIVGRNSLWRYYMNGIYEPTARMARGIERVFERYGITDPYDIWDE